MATHDSAGNERVTVYTPNKLYKCAAVNIAAAGTPVDLATPASGKTIRVMSYHLSLSVAGAVILKDKTASSAEVLRTPLMAAAAGQPSPNMGYGAKLSAADSILQVDSTANGTISGWIMAVEE